MELAAECMPLMTNARPEGGRERLGFQVEVPESAQSWRGLLIDLITAGLPTRQSRASRSR
jgi:putative transposase